MRHGFSLLELSIVLVIIGLLAGGVMTGQSLIRGAEIRGIITENQRFNTALNAFRDKYQAVPGDMKNATAFWGKDNTNCTGNTGTAATPGTCNGDGDGILVEPATAATTGETFQFWKQLALAGIIEGSYTGLSGPGNGYDFVSGTNSPTSRVSNAGWGNISYLSSYTGDSVKYSLPTYGNSLIFGGTMASNFPFGQVLKPEEAWNIDTKLDDGRPAYGKVIAVWWADCTTSTTKTDYAGTYKLSASTLACALIFPRSF